MVHAKCQVFEHNLKHMGLNVATIPKELLEQFREVVDSDPIYIEIRSTSGEIAYGYAWSEDIDRLTNKGDLLVGLDRALLDSCLVGEGDNVQIIPLLSSDILPASTLVIKPIAEAGSKIQTASDLEFIKNRIHAGENILRKDSRFLVPIVVADQTHALRFQVVDAEPHDVPLN
jgi:hypothetical protein